MTPQQKQFIIRKISEHTCPYCGTKLSSINIHFIDDSNLLAADNCCSNVANYIEELFTTYTKQMLDSILPLANNPTSLKTE